MKLFIANLRVFSRQYCTRTGSDEISQSQQRELRKRFFDTLRIYVRGGGGGQGFPKYGGVGGDGGNVILVSKKKKRLKEIKDLHPDKRFVAGTGKNSSKHCLLGDNGKDMILEVPVGVSVKTNDGEEIVDFDEEGLEHIVAKGGEGGNPGNNFLGRRGEARSIHLVLKLIADIGLVGFPNAGKSTFLSAISRTAPKIGDYPFTTLKPQIGTMVYPDHRRITVADLPGLIEGAHENYGLGHKFLRHIERTKVLLFMVDIFGFQLKQEHQHRSAFETILLLNQELELYKEELLDKPAVLALNKVDEDVDSHKVKEILERVKNLPESLSDVPQELHPKRLVKFDDIFVISAKEKVGTENVKNRLRQLLDLYADEKNMELALQAQETAYIIEKSKEQTSSRLI